MTYIETYWLGRTRLGRKLAEFLRAVADRLNGVTAIVPIELEDAGRFHRIKSANGWQPDDFSLIVDAANTRTIRAGVVQIAAVATTVDALGIDTTQQDYWVECTRTAAGVWSVNTTLQEGAIGTLYADSAGAITLKIPIGTMDADGWHQHHTGRIVFESHADELVRCSANDGTADYLHNQLADHDTYDSDHDVLVKAQTLNDGADESERLFVAEFDDAVGTVIQDYDFSTIVIDELGDIGTIGTAYEVLGKNTGGTIGWVTLQDFECPS